MSKFCPFVDLAAFAPRLATPGKGEAFWEALFFCGMRACFHRVM